MAKARSLQLTWRHLALAFSGVCILIVGLGSLFSYVTMRHAADLHLPFVQDMIRATYAAEAERSKEFLRENLNAMAVKMGQMQAQLIRIDSLGERLATLSGVKLEARPTPGKDGRGGPLLQPTPLSADDLRAALEALAKEVEARGDHMSLLESQLLDERIQKSMLPTTLPVDAQWNASGFGWRIDPFTGERALHEGVDFGAQVGTDIVAAASGVVITVDRHPEYGNMVEIDHGNGLSTRYAHISRTVVKVGALVRRGQKIAEVGTTGRTTGPHLHFEVRHEGVAVNPFRFLQNATAGRALAQR